jgi:hypothetical protein
LRLTACSPAKPATTSACITIQIPPNVVGSDRAWRREGRGRHDVRGHGRIVFAVVHALFVCLHNAGRSQTSQEVRATRDEIARRVAALVEELDGG